LGIWTSRNSRSGAGFGDGLHRLEPVGALGHDLDFRVRRQHFAQIPARQFFVVARRDVEEEIAAAEQDRADRRKEALLLVSYNLAKLNLHITSSRRILNDLRSLRRLLLAERGLRAEDESEVGAATRTHPQRLTRYTCAGCIDPSRACAQLYPSLLLFRSAQLVAKSSIYEN
jgi:hypothetical protein